MGNSCFDATVQKNAFGLRRAIQVQVRVMDLVNAQHSVLDRQWLTNVYPLYLHDLSAYDDSYYRLNAEGRWEPDHLPDWLSGTHQMPFVIHAETGRVGFAFVAKRPFPFVTPPADYRLCELFILRRHRRQGLGRRAASRLFEQHPGLWEVTQLPRNAPAIAFWRQVIGAHTQGTFQEVETPDEVRQMFHSPPSTAPA